MGDPMGWLRGSFVWFFHVCFQTFSIIIGDLFSETFRDLLRTCCPIISVYVSSNFRDFLRDIFSDHVRDFGDMFSDRFRNYVGTFS